MTLTVCIGASGSGKTTFLNDVYKIHKCVYLRQYHNLRPYITISKIPHFDPTQLPFWDVYVGEKKETTIQVGGTMAGNFYAGLSGGQRKMLLFELIYQRTKHREDLLIVLDEPFAGVTDDFVPYIVERLNRMRKQQNILLVTNDHVHTLTAISDNTITVSAIDRSTVQLNMRENIPRDQLLLALSIGDSFAVRYTSGTHEDLRFFYDVEIAFNTDIIGVAVFTTFSFVLLIATFWKSTPNQSEALVLIAADIISYFCVNPYLLALVDWRNLVVEESEALLHASVEKLKIYKTLLTLTLIFFIAAAEYGVINLVITSLRNVKYLIAIVFDNASLTFPLICTTIYTNLPFQAAHTYGSMPFLFMIFFSTTFSPGSGVQGFKSLRYLFPRFYFWCITPVIQDDMERCPEGDISILYLILTGFLNVFIFFVIKVIFALIFKRRHSKTMESKEKSMMTEGFADLQIELFGSKALKKLQHTVSVTPHLRNTDLGALVKSGDERYTVDLIEK